MSKHTSLLIKSTSILLMCVFLAPSTVTAQESEQQERDVLGDLKLPKLRRKRAPKVTEHASFKLVQGDGRVYFSLVCGDDVLLRSPGYATDRAVKDAMASVIKHIKRVRDMPMRQLDTGEYYFVVVTSRDDVLATSPLYSSKEEARTMRTRLNRVLVEDPETASN